MYIQFTSFVQGIVTFNPKSFSSKNTSRKTGNELEYSISHPANICSKLTIETLEQGVKYVQS